ncbi:hypothetical protein O9G_005774 [Rozella allomycis CSF55]|uniref:Reverse transcriptase domain-containing protein n=1 Tax=Rozella allomycis (strain CSF55) TaxID=988480 RepID=A0A075B0S7_ROZAC|nr:hypothetical protein O9G_005774 [Rozella allomycis CSF55]|eukprot:EPZ36154.1 hypothetical protein O9G_005774 [Rozella allomycis CSF55]
MAIKKLKIKNQKQIYKIYLFNSEQVISILKLPIGQRILDNSGNSINFAESFENIIKSANNFIIFKKISKSKPNFRDRETKEVLSTIAAKTTFKNPNLLFIETMSYAKSMELINYLNNNGKLFGCDWYQSNGRSSKEEHHLQHSIRNLQNDKSQANYKRPNFELPVPITPVMENKGSVRLSEEQLDSEMDETFAGPIDDPDNSFNTAIKESSIGKAYGFLRLRKRRTSFCISHTAHPNSRPMTTKRRPAKKGKKKYCTLCCFQGNIESNDKIISIMHQNVRGLVENNIVTDEPTQVKTKILTYYKDIIYKAKRRYHPTLQMLPQDWRELYTPPQISYPSLRALMAPITITEIQMAIKNSPNNKAPGPSGITFELLRLLPLAVINIMCAAFNSIMTFGTIPKCLLEMHLIILAKDKKWTGDISRTRPIALLECIKKLISLIITQRLNSYISANNLLQGANAGFTPGHSCTDILIPLQTVMDHANEHKNPLYILTIDIKKAYDTVKPSSMTLALKRLGIPDGFTNAIIRLEMTRDIVIKTHYGPTESFQPEQSIAQGSPASCILFKAHCDPLYIMTKRLNLGYKLGRSTVSTIGFF